MNSSSDITFVKGSLRYKRAPEIGIELTVPLSGKVKELDEFARTTSINLAEVYDKERQSSNFYIPSCKFQFVFSNAYKGSAMTLNEPYPPFNNNLVYYNVEQTKEQTFLNPNVIIQWPGFPQYNEFTFIRTDNNTPGYTQPPNEHVLFQNSEASFYNWYFYLTYPSENDDTKVLKDTPTNTQWTPSQGLPFIMDYVIFNGINLWQFKCPVKHNLSVGDFVKLEGIDIKNSGGGIVANRDLIFEVYSLGNGTFKSDEKIFNILDFGFNTGNGTFDNGAKGFFFRIVDASNPTESKSEYYVRKHKVLTNWRDAIVTFSGFEQNAFRTARVYQPADLTPDQVGKVATKEDSQSYNVSFNGSIDLTNIIDNQGRPVTELFVTTINRGYFGYFNPRISSTNTSLKQGWEFNLENQTDTWWENTNTDALVNLQLETYSKTYITNTTSTTLDFFYNTNYNVGDLIDGDLCEWNDITQKETVLSEIYHKLNFNPSTFNIGGSITNPFGYYYRPFYKIQLRVYSDYVESGDATSTEDAPFYSYYSRNNNTFIWRDLYTFGFIDADGNGVNYPYMNNRHYPYENFIFRIIPEGRNTTDIYDIQRPVIDGCE